MGGSKEKDRIFVEVNDEDLESFNDATDECNTVHLQICEERGIDPTETALDYERANATNSKKVNDEVPDLEEVDNDNDENEDNDIEKNERRSSLRSASKKKEKRV